MSGEIAKKTVEAYFEGLNHNNSSELLKVSHFPHFRISPKGELIVFETPTDFMKWFYNKTNSDNWHHSELNKINTSLITDTKLHSQFTFTRYRSDNSIIGQYQAIYIIIYVNGKWGIKGGSGNG